MRQKSTRDKNEATTEKFSFAYKQLYAEKWQSF